MVTLRPLSSTLTMDFKGNNKAIYLQIADKICDEITIARRFPPGERIPSVREYAATLQVNANTVVHAYEYLQQSGVVFNRRGVGYFVCEDAQEVIRRMHEDSFLGGEMQYFFSRLQAMGITPEHLSDLYYEFCKTSNQ